MWYFKLVSRSTLASVPTVVRRLSGCKRDRATCSHRLRRPVAETDLRRFTSTWSHNRWRGSLLHCCRWFGRCCHGHSVGVNVSLQRVWRQIFHMFAGPTLWVVLKLVQTHTLHRLHQAHARFICRIQTRFRNRKQTAGALLSLLLVRLISHHLTEN